MCKLETHKTLSYHNLLLSHNLLLLSSQLNIINFNDTALALYSLAPEAETKHYQTDRQCVTLLENVKSPFIMTIYPLLRTSARAKVRSRKRHGVGTLVLRA